jgi:hypothetical protein
VNVSRGHKLLRVTFMLLYNGMKASFTSFMSFVHVGCIDPLSLECFKGSFMICVDSARAVLWRLLRAGAVIDSRTSSSSKHK